MSGLTVDELEQIERRSAVEYRGDGVSVLWDDAQRLLAEVRRLRALELRVRALTTEPGCRHDGETYCGNAILEALDEPTPTPPVRPVDGGNP